MNNARCMEDWLGTYIYLVNRLRATGRYRVELRCKNMQRIAKESQGESPSGFRSLSEEEEQEEKNSSGSKGRRLQPSRYSLELNNPVTVLHWYGWAEK